MSFFSRKPNPPVPPAANKALAAGLTSPIGPTGNPVASRNPPVTSGQGGVEQQQKKSNQRFRSFAERYVVERCRDWKEGEISERAWAAILEAKTTYNQIKEVGRTLDHDD